MSPPDWYLAGLLRLLPKGFRERHGKELTDLLVEMRKQLGPSPGAVALLRFYGAVTCDVLRSALSVGVRYDRPTRHSRRAVLSVGDGLDFVRQEGSRAVRRLVRHPGFTIPTVVTLALGIGAATAGFAVVDAVVLRPLPFADADRLTWIDSPVPRMEPGAAWGLSVAGYFEFQRSARSFERIGGFGISNISIAGEENAFRVRAASVQAELLDVLQARATIGRLIENEDDDPLAKVRAVVLGYDFWQREFGGDERVVGRVVRIEDEPSEVIGVMERGLTLPNEEIDVWVPLVLDPAQPPQNSHWLAAVGRLSGGSTFASAQAELAGITGRFPDLFPGAYSAQFMEDYGFTTRVRSLAEYVVGPDVRRSLWIVVVAVVLVLIIACANVANLLLARTESQRREAALMSALVAGRARTAIHGLAETLLLTYTSAVGGIAVAQGALTLLIEAAPPGLPRTSEIEVGGFSVGFAIALATILGIVFGSLPSVASPPSYSALRQGSPGVTASRSAHRIRKTLVVAQTALAVVLLSSAALFVRSVHELGRIHPGFDPSNSFAFELSLPRGRYGTPSTATAFARETIRRIEQIPGVLAAGVGETLPFGAVTCAPVQGDGQVPDAGDSTPCVDKQQVSPGFFSALGVEIIEGNAPTWDALDAGAGEVVVTDALAARLWPGQDPIGRGIRPRGSTWYRVVGVTEPLRLRGLDEPANEAVFYPLLPIEGSDLWGARTRAFVVVRTEGQPILATLVPAVRGILKEIDPAVPLGTIQTLETHLDSSLPMVRRSFMMMLMTVVGAISLLLSVAGTYGLISYIVGERRSELGLRFALGARRSSIARMLLKGSIGLSCVGIVLGLFGSIAFSRALDSLLFGVSPTEPVTLGTVALLLLGVSLVATWVPTRRALQVDPVRSLRAE